MLVRRVVFLSGQAPPPPTGAAAWPSGSSGARNTSDGGGFALHEACWRRVVGVSDAHVVQFPPFGGVASHGYRVWALSTGRPGVSETVIVFAGEQWCWWFQRRRVVAPRARHFSPCSARCGCEREKVLPASLVDRESAKKFALCRCFSANARKSSPCALKLGRNWRFMARWASFFAEELLEGPCRANFVAPIGPAPVLDAMRCTSGWWRWGVLQH